MEALIHTLQMAYEVEEDSHSKKKTNDIDCRHHVESVRSIPLKERTGVWTFSSTEEMKIKSQKQINTSSKTNLSFSSDNLAQIRKF